jgi:hypothetical protein
MLRVSVLAALAAAVFALSAWTLEGRNSSVEAGKPALVVGQATFTDCMGTVNWSGLKGGKTLWIRTWLVYDSGNPVVGTNQSIAVRQGAGRFERDFSALEIDVEALASAVGMEVRFEDHKFNTIDSAFATGECE